MAVGGGVIALGDFEQVVEDAAQVVGVLAELIGEVSSEYRVDRGLLYYVHRN